MAKTCPLCEAREDRKLIEALVENGGDLSAVKKVLKDKGVEASTYAIRKHFKDHTKLKPDQIHESLITKVLPTKEEREQLAKEKASRDEEVKEYLDNVATIDMDRVLAAVGVTGMCESMTDVLTLVQKMSIALHTASSAIAYDRLDRFMRDPEGRRYPQVELRGAKMTSEMVSEAFGYQQAVNLQTAADTVEKAGYKILDGSATSGE